MNSRAVHVDIAPDYSTDTFSQLYRPFSSIRGWPQSVFSDNGTQLVSASKELKDAITGLNWKKILQYGHRNGFKWTFSPADALWYNGTAEALITSAPHPRTLRRFVKYTNLQTD